MEKKVPDLESTKRIAAQKKLNSILPSIPQFRNNDFNTER